MNCKSISWSHKLKFCKTFIFVFQNEITLKYWLEARSVFFNCYLAAPWPTLGHYWGDSFTNAMFITALHWFQPESHQEHHKEVGSLSSVRHLVGFELGIISLLIVMPWPTKLLPLCLSLSFYLSRVKWMRLIDKKM